MTIYIQNFNDPSKAWDWVGSLKEVKYLKERPGYCPESTKTYRAIVGEKLATEVDKCGQNRSKENGHRH